MKLYGRGGQRVVILTLALLLTWFSQAPWGRPVVRSQSLSLVSPLQGQIIFQAKQPTPTGTKRLEVLMMEEDGSDVRQVSPEKGTDVRPFWSPDGTQIVMSSTFFGTRDIVIMNADGTELVRLTNDDAADYDPAWSPYGQSILFVSPDAGGIDDIWVMNTDGSNRRDLTNTPLYDEHNPSWSMDGRFVFFSSRRDLDALDIWIMNADGSNQRRWSKTDKQIADHVASWHPFLPKVAYHSHAGLPGQIKGGRIWVADVDGNGDIVTAQPVTDIVNPNQKDFGDESPDWSPDGTRIVFTSPRVDPDRDIYTMNADGSNVVTLTDTRRHEYHPRWSPRAQRLRNGGMEHDQDSDGIPDDWTAFNLEPGDGRTTSDAKSGGASVLVQGNPSLDKRFQQLLVLSGPAGQTLTLAAWSQVSGFTPTGTYKLTLTLLHPDSSTTEFTLNLLRRQNWRYSKATFTAPKSYDQVQVEIQYGFQTGRALFDNIALYR